MPNIRIQGNTFLQLDPELERILQLNHRKTKHEREAHLEGFQDNSDNLLSPFFGTVQEIIDQTSDQLLAETNLANTRRDVNTHRITLEIELERQRQGANHRVELDGNQDRVRKDREEVLLPYQYFTLYDD